MGRAVIWLVALLGAAAAHGAEIDGVLERSQQLRLARLVAAPADDPRAQAVRRSFERVVEAMAVSAPLELRVVTGPALAESLLGRVVVANVSLGELPEGERLFVLAHEVGHVANGHWAGFAALWREHLPGAVVPAETERIAPLLGPQASALMHGHELDADAFALVALARLGHGIDSALAVFVRQGVQHDTATHPGTRKRLAHLRSRQP